MAEKPSQPSSSSEGDSEEIEEPLPSPSLQRRGSRTMAQSQGTKQYRPEFDSDLRDEHANTKLWSLMDTYIDSEKTTIQHGIVAHVEYTLARTRFNFDQHSCYLATALSIRDRLLESWNDTQQMFTADDHKRVYYLSLEYLLGRMMQNALVNLNLESKYRDALLEMGYALEDLYEEEGDPALGSGGLGRLAACFLDSLASLDYPAWGYGLRYDYGTFRQLIYKGYQLEVPDCWLSQGNPWEIERTDVSYDIPLYGRIETYWEGCFERKIWIPGEVVRAVAFDTPIPGFDTFNTINLRLWKSRPSSEFDFQSFEKGDYQRAIEARQRAEYITSVLYPDDVTEGGKELRLKQQYFFCAATIKDVLRRFQKKQRRWEELPDKIAIQLNDTPPAIAIPELLRTLIDDYKLEWRRAWNICHKVFSYTNHTVMPEALEKWSVALMAALLPRHLEIIFLINHLFMEQVADRFKRDPRKADLMRDMSLIEEGDVKMVRMANLCIVGSHAVVGVAELHTKLLITRLFPNLHSYFPGKFCNTTNGVTPRRWIMLANKELTKLYTYQLGTLEWVRDLTRLRELLPLASDPGFQQSFFRVKLANKERLASWVLKETGVEINPEALFDVQVKRIHEYKRQLLNALYMVHRYLELKAMSTESRTNEVKRVFLVGGKAASGYIAAKKIIKLLTSIQDVVNNDAEIGDLMKVVFLPNYGVTVAQVIIPAADLSQHISTAGSEASGTSNMKFVMNGSVILGTLDGANVEIRNEIGKENIFIFGARTEEVAELRARMREQRGYPIGAQLLTVIDAICQGRFGNTKELSSLIDSLQTGNDYYLVCHDFYPYLEAQKRVDETYRNQKLWRKMVITGAVSMGYFSSDRAVIEYATEIWSLNSVTIPTPAESALTRVRSQPHLGDRPKDEFEAAAMVRDVSIEELAHTLSGGESLLHTRSL